MPPDRPASPRSRPALLGVIALGGALGAPARYGVAQVIHVAPNSFPWATFWTNVTGSFALGAILALILERFPPTRYLRPFLATGFCGAYTTFSTYAVEVDLLVKHARPVLALTYALSSLLLGLGAVWAGMVGARAVRLGTRGGGEQGGRR